MGLLLAQYEYQRSKQKVNVLQAKTNNLNDLSERYQKRIGQIEKEYGKRATQLESRYTQLQSRLSSQISSYATSQNGAGMASIFTVFNVNVGNIDQEARAIAGTDSTSTDSTSTSSTSSAYKQSTLISAYSTIASQLQTLLQSMITALKDAEVEDLEAAEEEVKEPISMKDSEITSEIASTQTMLDFQKERRDAAKTALDDAIKNSVAHFGLGG